MAHRQRDNGLGVPRRIEEFVGVVRGARQCHRDCPEEPTHEDPEDHEADLHQGGGKCGS